jgi:uncharacterized protein (TIGR02246 family)
LRRALAAFGLAAALLLAAGRSSLARGEDDSPFALTMFVQRYFAAWNEHDPSALARVFSEDGEATDTLGQTVRGRAAIEAAARPLFNGVYKDAQIHFVRIDTRAVAPGVVAIDVRWWIVGATTSGWERKQYGLSAWIAKLDRGEWQIFAAHEQLLAPPALAPPPASPGPPSAEGPAGSRLTHRAGSASLKPMFCLALVSRCCCAPSMVRGEVVRA